MSNNDPFLTTNANNAELRHTAKEMAAASELATTDNYIRSVANGWHDNHAHRLLNHGMGAVNAARGGDMILAAALNRVRN